MMTKGKVFVLLARGFEEMDVSTVTRTLRGLGLSVAVVGLTTGPVRGAYGLSLVPDCTLSEVEMELPEAVILPGGVLAATRFSAEPRVRTLLRQVAAQQGYVMAVGTARTVLRSAGLLSGSEPVPGNGSEQGVSVRDEIEVLPSGRVWVEGHVIVSHDSGAAQEAARRLAVMLER